MGIGNELNGDDSAGVVVAQKLLERLKIQPNLLVMNCGSIPENATGALRRFQPHLVLMIDAADMGVEPGAICILDLTEVRGFSASSHSMPLNVLAGFIENEFQCKTMLLGIQPQSLDFEDRLSSIVRHTVNEIVEIISEFFV